MVAVERLSPSFVRVELGGPALAEFGVDGPLYDLRIKLVFPNDAGELPSFAGADESWWDTWLELPEAERGHMRTYTVREVRGTGADTRLVVDLVLHPAEGEAGPGSAWAEQASVGDRLVTHGPAPRCRVRRHRVRRPEPRASCCWWPTRPPCRRCAASWRTSTATPAGSRCSRCRCGGRAALAEQVARRTSRSSGCRGTGRRSGRSSMPRCEARLGVGGGAGSSGGREEVDPDLWETPAYSSSGEDIECAVATVGHDLDGLYAWIAGESKVVTGLRRLLVNGAGHGPPPGRLHGLLAAGGRDAFD